MGAFLRNVVVALALAGVAAWTLPGSGPSVATAASSSTRRVNVPLIQAGQPFTPAIFWLGKVGPTTNYADVRVFSYDEGFTVYLHITDRLLWHDPSANPAQLTAWDAVSLFIDVQGNTGAAPGQTSYWLVTQLSGGKALYRGNGSSWAAGTAAFTTASTWRGNGPNDDVWDMGWETEFDIPFSSLGLSAAPAPGTLWGLGVAVHDRDDAAGTAIPDEVWPESLQRLRPDSWGQLRFGRPAYTPATSVVEGTALVRQGLNGAVVPDAAVGGHTVCGEGMDAWNEWGNANYAGYTQFNIQNQWDIADFMCFSKYYVTFPLSAVPAGKTIVSATVRLNLFGNAGYTPTDATPSAINALTVADDWTESTITWNNAPYAAENTSVTWVYPVDASHPAGPYEWDVGYAAAEAVKAGRPLRLAFYSTDGDYHSGKYFYTSDSTDWGGTVRPTLEVRWGSTAPAPPAGVRIIKHP